MRNPLKPTAGAGPPYLIGGMVNNHLADYLRDHAAQLHDPGLA